MSCIHFFILFQKIEDIDVELKKKLEFIKKEYSDEVTFQVSFHECINIVLRCFSLQFW